MGMFLQKFVNIKTKSGSSFKNFDVSCACSPSTLSSIARTRQVRSISFLVLTEYAWFYSAYSPSTLNFIWRTRRVRSIMCT